MKAALIITGREIVTGLKRDALIQPFASELKSCGAEVAEIRELRVKRGISGVIAGRSLYDGRIDLAAALDAAA